MLRSSSEALSHTDLETFVRIVGRRFVHLSVSPALPHRKGCGAGSRRCIQPLFARSLAQPHGGTHALHDGLAERAVRPLRVPYRAGRRAAFRALWARLSYTSEKYSFGRIASSRPSRGEAQSSSCNAPPKPNRSTPRSYIYGARRRGRCQKMKPRRSGHVVHHLDTRLPRTLVGKQGTEKDILQLLAKIGLGILESYSLSSNRI